MAAWLRARTLSRIAPLVPRLPQFASCFHTTVTMSEEQMRELQANPYFGKYADKIAKLKQTSPEEFLARLADAEEQRKKSNQKFGGGCGGDNEREFSLPTRPKQDVRGGGAAMTREKKLSDRMKLELLQDKTKEEIGDIWRRYHADKDSVAAVIPAVVFSQMEQRFKLFKLFLLPLPRKQGYEFVVVQFEGKEAHFTTLINYQAHQENAPECLTLTHYTDLAEEKGIVLMVGEFDTNVLSVQEAQCLANQVELYYSNPSEEKLKLLKTFTERPNEFKHADLISQMDTISLLAK